jgi:hypothetical protein
LRFSRNSFRRSRQRAKLSPDSSYLLELLEIDELAEEPPSRWLGTQAAGSELGLEIGGPVGVGDLVAADELLGPVVELLFMAPVSVSTVWGLDPSARDAIEQARERAIDLALARLGLAVGAVPIAAQFTHSFARLPPPDAPPPQLHTHVLIIAVDIDEESEESVAIGPPDALPPSRARLGFVPDALDTAAPIAYDAYLSRLSANLRKLNYDIGDRGEIEGVPANLTVEFAPKPCGMGSPGRAVYLRSRMSRGHFP